MPFDDTSKIEIVSDILSDELLKIGVIPIPQNFVSAYKASVEKNAERHYGWQNHWSKQICDRLDDVNLVLRKVHRGSISTNAQVMPEPVYKIADFVRNNVTDPVFQIEYYADDPILSVRYGPRHDRRNAVLGIWDKKLLHIARQSQESQDPPKQGFFGNLFKRIFK